MFAACVNIFAPPNGQRGAHRCLSLLHLFWTGAQRCLPIHRDPLTYSETLLHAPSRPHERSRNIARPFIAFFGLSRHVAFPSITFFGPSSNVALPLILAR
jgi:hypothetical protein